MITIDKNNRTSGNESIKMVTVTAIVATEVKNKTSGYNGNVSKNKNKWS